MSFKCKDGLIIWKEGTVSFLPEKYENDQLSVYIRMLISKVKEDHAEHQYKRDLKNYVNDIKFIVDLATKNGYQITEYDKSRVSTEAKSEKQDNGNLEDDFDFDSIVDA